MRFSFAPIGGYLGLLVLAVVLLLLLVLVTPSRDRLAGRRRRALALLRALSMLVLLWAMLRPAVVWQEVKEQLSTLVLLVDQSRSMQVTDETAGQSRFAAQQAALVAVQPLLDELRERFDIRLYAYDQQVHPLPWSAGPLPLPAEPVGDQTALGATLEDILRREAGKRLAGVILLGDGAQRATPPQDLPPQMPARRMAQLGQRLFAVPLGKTDPGQARDVALDGIQATERVFVKNQLTVFTTARLTGYAQQPVQVQLLFELEPGRQEVVATAPVMAQQDGQRVPLELQYVPEQAGEYKVTLRAAPQPGELVTTNNDVTTYVTVLKGGLNVLYLEGALRVEQKFIRRALDASPDIRVDYFRIDAARPETRPSDLDERIAPGKYDVYLLGDLDAAAFTPEQLDRLAQLVEQGAGLMMLGGFNSFGPGGYAQTPLAALLPVAMSPLERQKLGDLPRADVHLAGDQPLRPTAEAARLRLMDLAPGVQNEQAWAELPPLDGANRFSAVKPAATVLLQTPTADPLLVAQTFGTGRVLAFAGDSTWQWWLHGHEGAHKRFWRQVILWLARKDPSTEGEVWVDLDQRRFSPGSRVEFRVGANSPEGEPVVDATFTVQVTTPDGRAVASRVVRQGDTWTGSLLETFAPGEYAIEVQAAHDGQSLGSGRARFAVYEQDLELENSVAERGTLESLARTTGGRLVPPEQLTALLDELQQQSQDQQIEIETKRNLYDNIWLLLTLVGLLGTEWYLRKRWGLV